MIIVNGIIINDEEIEYAEPQKEDMQHDNETTYIRFKNKDGVNYEPFTTNELMNAINNKNKKEEK